MTELITQEGTPGGAGGRRRGAWRRLPVAALGGVASALGLRSVLAQDANDEFVGEIQDGVADTLSERGVPYEFDDDPPPAPAPLPPPPSLTGEAPVAVAPGTPVEPVTSSSVEPAPGSEGVPVEDPVGAAQIAAAPETETEAETEATLTDDTPDAGEGLALASSEGGDDNLGFVS